MIIQNFEELATSGSKKDCLEIYPRILEAELPLRPALFLDFDKKYLDFSRSEKVHEADISDELKKALYSAFEKIYKPAFKGALIRCDFFVVDDKVLLNEINPIPGSMANYLFDDFTSLITNMSLPKKREIKVNYTYLHSIRSAKGKA